MVTQTESSEPPTPLFRRKNDRVPLKFTSTLSCLPNLANHDLFYPWEWLVLDITYLGTQVRELKEYNLITVQVQNSIETFSFQVKRQIFLATVICE